MTHSIKALPTWKQSDTMSYIKLKYKVAMCNFPHSFTNLPIYSFYLKSLY